jgi:hypothetical protein
VIQVLGILTALLTGSQELGGTVVILINAMAHAPELTVIMRSTTALVYPALI